MQLVITRGAATRRCCCASQRHVYGVGRILRRETVAVAARRVGELRPLAAFAFSAGDADRAA